MGMKKNSGVGHLPKIGEPIEIKIGEFKARLAFSKIRRYPKTKTVVFSDRLLLPDGPHYSGAVLDFRISIKTEPLRTPNKRRKK